MIPLILKPQDPLARDTVSGSGSCDNDLLAQPLCLPLRGKYNGLGGIERDKGDVGHASLEKTLRDFVENARLYKLKNAEPVICRKLPRDFIDLLSSGELVVMTPNPRKEWLVNLHKVYNEAEDKSGFSHYLPQLKVDPKTLSDMLMMPLALNFVSATLYDALAKKVGQGESFDRWNEAKGKPESFKGTREKQVNADFTLNLAEKKKIEMTLTWLSEKAKDVLGAMEEEGSEKISSEEMKDMIVSVHLCNVAPMAFESAGKRYFSPKGISSALQDVLINNNVALRDEFVKFDLFSTAMDQMRKQWVPQTGNGSSNGLQEDSTRELYQLTGQFIASSCSLSLQNDCEP
jgi:hypothetical protein